MQYVVGLDVGGTKCAVLLAKIGINIEIIDKIRFETESAKGFEYAKNNLFQCIYDIVKRNHLKLQDVTAIGVSCGGPLDSRSGIVLCPPNLPGWVNIPFVSMLEKEFHCPAYIQNDANACALVEWKLGAGIGTNNMMFLTMGTGMGGGIIAEGRLLVGASDMGGEVGHIRIEKDGPLGFEKYGSFEGFCSGGGIARLASDLAIKALNLGSPFSWGKTVEEIELLNTKVVADLAKAGDENAIHVFDIVGEKLGKGISYFIDILNPEVIVIGSIFGRCENLLRPPMEKVIEKECISYSKEVCKVVPAKTGEQIGDLASIMAAVYGQNLSFDTVDKKEVLDIFERLFQRYPKLCCNRDSIFKAYETIKQTYLNGGKLMCCGNGGSASDSAHIVGELMKGFQKQRKVTDMKLAHAIDELSADGETLMNHLQGALKCMAFTQQDALSTAFSNDVKADMVYAQQVYGFADVGDTLLAISTSGNSINVVNAVLVAKAKGIKTVALTGFAKSRLSELCDVTIQAEGNVTAEIQELHLPIYHALCAMLEAEFFDD